MQNDFVHPEPIQPGGTPDQLGGDGKVHRQRGIDPERLELARDPLPLPEIIQGSPEIHVTRNVGIQHFLADGTLIADHRAEDSTYFSDVPVIAVGEANQPPTVHAPLAASDLPLPPPPGFDVTPSDGGAVDPRDASTGPQIMVKDQLPVIKKALIVPVVISAPDAVIVRAERIAATLAAAKKKGKK